MVPVEDLSGKEEDYFAAGLTEDMISALSRIDPGTAAGDLSSQARGRRWHRRSISTGCRRELNLDYLLRGSVRRSADKLRISAQLHDLRDQSVLWSETYDRKASDLLAVQEEVTQRVSRKPGGGTFPERDGGIAEIFASLRRLMTLI